MTVPTTTSSVVYTATGSDDTYIYTWRTFNDSDLVVFLQDTDGAVTQLTLTTDYTVTGVDFPTGGTVVLVAGDLTAGWRIFIASDPSQVQDLLLQQGAAANPGDVMNELDQQVRMIQATRRIANGAVQIPEAESLDGYTTTLPDAAARANLYVGFDGSGNVTVLDGQTSGVIPAVSLIQVVDTIANLTALAKPAAALTYLVRWYTTDGDGGGGTFWWDSTSNATDNGGTILAADSGGVGRWMRLYDGAYNVRWFGARA